MSRVLIASLDQDAHATVVAHAMRQCGHSASLWYGDFYPGSQTHSTYIADDCDFVWHARGDGIRGGDIDAGFDAVWARRIQAPQRGENVHPEDAEFVDRELLQYHSAIWNAIEPDAFWVNPLTAIRPSESKLNQLRLAHAVGLPVPPTLVSNDPDDIRAFLARHAAGGAMYKGFFPASWTDEDGRRLALPTREVRLEDLPPDAMLQSAPGIFQARVDKAYEIRLTMFGDYPLAARIDTGDHEAGAEDWRNMHITRVPMSPYTMPETVLEMVRLFMRRIGIVFGCFDFIVTPAGDHVFLEVNQAGQWLWVEQKLPEMPMLATFCAFLAGGRRRFDGPMDNPEIRLSACISDID